MKKLPTNKKSTNLNLLAVLFLVKEGGLLSVANGINRIRLKLLLEA